MKNLGGGNPTGRQHFGDGLSSSHQNMAAINLNMNTLAKLQNSSNLYKKVLTGWLPLNVLVMVPSSSSEECGSRILSC